MIVVTKKCTRCSETKLLSEFGRRPERPSGVRSKCKVCESVLQQERVRRRKQRTITPRDKDPAALKRCPQCYELKSRDSFYAALETADGCATYCTTCMQSRRASYYVQHSDSRRSRAKAYAALNKQRAITPRELDHTVLKRCPKCDTVKQRAYFYPKRTTADGCSQVCKECDTASSRAWNNANRKRCSENLRRWYSANIVHCRDYSRAWCAANRQKTREATRKRRDAKRVLAELFTTDMDDFVRMFWGSHCAICGIEVTAANPCHIDHWLPLSKGHALTMANAVLLCRSCNSSKNNRLPSTMYTATVIAQIEEQLCQQVVAWQAYDAIASELVIDID